MKDAAPWQMDDTCDLMDVGWVLMLLDRFHNVWGIPGDILDVWRRSENTIFVSRPSTDKVVFKQRDTNGNQAVLTLEINESADHEQSRVTRITLTLED